MTASSVHTPTAIGNEKPKAKKFPAVLAELKAADVEKRVFHYHDHTGTMSVEAIHGNREALAAAVRKATGDLAKRELHPNTDGATAKSPFLYDPNALGSLRPDQVPKFFGALTDGDKLPTKEVKLADLHAMQDRVDPEKVNAIGSAGPHGKLAVVVRHNGRDYIADGHHRLTAEWLAGKETAEVHHKDLEVVDDAVKRAEPLNFRIAKVDDALGLVFGFAIVCKIGGEDYYDLNIDHDGPHAGERVPEHVPEDAMAKAALGLAEVGAPGNVMHAGPDRGHYPFLFPLTTDIAKAMGIQSEKTGLMVAYKAPPDVLAKFRDGTFTGFSIEGRRLEYTEHPA